ncbi:hypothetical protein ACFOHU_17545 [Ottowia pentelensis]|uniref:MarR family transcriptional regulator n=2 Tax=Ottowia pentelensis TaxID=511108 RepID=A0ABV6PWA2_9BURK
MTRTKRAALAALAELGSDFSEWGEPPYAVSDIARHIGADISNLVKTMKLLEREGLVVREVAIRECWNAIAGGGVPRRCVCYWLAATMEADKASAAEWVAGADERSRRAFATLFAPSTVLDVDAVVVQTAPLLPMQRIQDAQSGMDTEQGEGVNSTKA